MKSVSISGSFRKGVGRKDAKLNRSEGKIPAVLYGGKEQYHFTIDEMAFEKIVTSPAVYIYKLNIEGKEFDAIVQDTQLHPVTDRIIHVDFLELLAGKPVTIKVPVNFVGSPEGVLKGGVLLKKLKKITLRALPDILPDNITLDVAKLDIGDSIRVSDIKLDNFQILEIPNAVVVGVRTARAVVEEVPVEGAVPAEGAAAPGTAAPGAAAPGAAAPGAAAPGAAAPGAKGAPEKPGKGKEGKGK